MKETIVIPFIQWEPNEANLEVGMNHIFTKVIQSEIPHFQANKYLCGRAFSKEPATNAIELEQMIDPTYRNKVMSQNLCPTCFSEFNRKFPKSK